MADASDRPESLLTLDQTDLGVLYPAHLRLDRRGRIIAAGPSIERISDGAFAGRDFFDCFEVELPVAAATLSALIAVRDVVIVRARGASAIRLRGLVLPRGETVYFLFAHLAEVEASSNAGLRYDDFSPIDGSLDMLLAAELRQELLKDAQRLARELEREKKTAVAADAAKSVFLATMSHEIRTPMNGVLGMASLLARTNLDESQRDYLNVIADCGGSLMAILNGILDLARIESGKLDVERTDFNVLTLIGDVRFLYQAKAQEKGLTLDIETPPGFDGAVRSDPTRLQQILNNLVLNAVKFTDEGGVLIRLSWTPPPAAGGAGELAISIIDTGIGIDAEACARLFTPFSQADPSLSRKYGGTGLGLAISKSLCELLGGSIGVDSAPGAGSSFTVRLPCEIATSEATSAAATPCGDAVKDALAPLRILVAEDNEVNRLVLGAFLRPAVAVIDFAVNGAEAVEAYRRGAYDLVLMDIQMPVMDGVCAFRAIRRFELESNRPRTPVIALTANAMKHQVTEYLSAGMDGHIAKPVDEKTLFATLAGGVRAAA